MGNESKGTVLKNENVHLLIFVTAQSASSTVWRHMREEPRFFPVHTHAAVNEFVWVYCFGEQLGWVTSSERAWSEIVWNDDSKYDHVHTEQRFAYV